MTHPPATMTTEAHPKIHGAWDILTSGGSMCDGGYSLAPNFSAIAGVASIPNGNEVPVIEHFARSRLSSSGKLTFQYVLPVHQSSGFASPSTSSRIVQVQYGPDGKVWWVEQVSPTELIVHDGRAKAYTMSVPSTTTPGGGSTTLEWGTGGGWYLETVENDNDDDVVWMTPNGTIVANSQHACAGGQTLCPQGNPLPTSQQLFPPYNATIFGSLANLLPSTQYQLDGGIYSTNHKSIVFWARPPGGHMELFTVAASGGSPTQFSPGTRFGNYFDRSLLYYGPYPSG